MRGNIVVPHDIDSMTNFAPGLAMMCEELSSPRYQRTRAKGGLTIAAAITGIHRQVEWCIATLSGKSTPPATAKVLPQKGLSKTMDKACLRLDKIMKRFRTRKALGQFLPLPDPVFGGMIALRADTAINLGVIQYEIYQYHLRRAFYTIDRNSGFEFPGGSAESLKIYEASVLSKLYPIY